jgi:hypothetical protein
MFPRIGMACCLLIDLAAFSGMGLLLHQWAAPVVYQTVLGASAG